MDTPLDRLFKHAADFAASTFKSTGAVEAMWIAEGREHLVIATPWDSNEAKNAIVGALKTMFQEKGVVRYAMMAEAWSVALPDKKMPESWERGASLASHPERREIISVVASDKDRTIQGFYYILRPEHGEAKLSPLELMGECVTGRFIGLLGDDHA
jgi:hypothetical protein